MLNLLLMCLLITTLFCPPYLLLKMESGFKWGTRYFLSVLPAAYTGLGWLLASYAYHAINCQGGVKNIHGCFVSGVDITMFIGHGLFLMIPFIFLALPLSLWLLLNTSAKQLGTWHRKIKKED